MSLTDEQIALEFMHMEIDAELANTGKQKYKDEEFEDYEKVTEETDNKLSYEYEAAFDDSEEDTLPASEGNKEEEWEDVEIDGFE